MGACIFLAPAIIASWPAIAAAIGGAATVMGLNMAREEGKTRKDPDNLGKKKITVEKVEMDIEQSDVLEAGIQGKEEIVLNKKDIQVRIARDENGRLRFTVTGANHSRKELEEFGRQIMENVTQNYIYNRIVTELKQRNIQVTREEVTEDKTVRIYVRNVLE